METTNIDKALADTIKSLTDVTPETIEKVKAAYTATIIDDASVSIWMGGAMAALFLVAAVITWLNDNEFMPFICLIVFLICTFIAWDAAIDLKAPEAFAVKHLVKELLHK